VYPSSSTVYRVTATACSDKITFVDFTITPTLQVTSSAGDAAVCPGTNVTLNASGATSGSTYFLEENGSVTQQNQTGVFEVKPQTSTTYKVTTNTLTCGGSVATQTIQVATNNITLSSSATNIASGTEVTINATGGTVGQYTWTQRDPSFTTIAETGSQIKVKPTQTTVYTVRGNTAVGNCPSSFSVTVMVNNQPLPVELVKFDAIWVNNSPKLMWATATEKNSAYFNIERSVDGVNFNVIGNLPGAGTKFSRTEYQFTDGSFAEIAANILYYRLHQVDITGESNYSPVRTVQPKAGKNTFQAEVFPNPYDERVTVQYRTFGTGVTTLTIHDMLGHTLLTKTVAAVAGAQEIELPEAASLSAGVYYLTIRQGGQQQVIKLSHR
jgi:hypothetical protein